MHTATAYYIACGHWQSFHRSRWGHTITISVTTGSLVQEGCSWGHGD